MAEKFQQLKNELRSLEKGEILSENIGKGNSTKGLFRSVFSSRKWFRKFLFAAFLGSFFIYIGTTYLGSSFSVDSPFTSVQSWVFQPDEELLEGMGDWMEEMGYANLSREDLIELRRKGVTATFTSRIRDLGYPDITLDEVVRLSQNDVSSTFVAMMKELGYTLSIDDLVELRQHGVTAHYTSNLHDLGYSDITKGELIRLKDTGVQISEVRALLGNSDQKPTIEELIRYHISNQ